MTVSTLSRMRGLAAPQEVVFMVILSAACIWRAETAVVELALPGVAPIIQASHPMATPSAALPRVWILDLRDASLTRLIFPRLLQV